RAASRTTSRRSRSVIASASSGSITISVAGSAKASPSLLGLFDDHPLDLAQGHLQEARAQLAKRGDVAGAEEAVVALAALAIACARQAALVEGPGRRGGHRVPRRDQAHVAAEDALQIG